MKAFTKPLLSGLLTLLLLGTLACGTQQEHATGEDAAETNRENPTVENRDETGDGFTRSRNDGSADAEVGPSPGVDSTTDSTQIKARMGR